MTHNRAVLTIDSHKAQFTKLDGENPDTRHFKAKTHETRQHNSDVRDVHEFFAEVSDALAGTAQILVTGSHDGLNAYRHYVEKHRPQLAPHILGYEVTDHPTDGQLAAFARDFFDKHERLAHPAD